MSRRVKLLIDECLHTSLVKVATDRLYEAYHVAHLGVRVGPICFGRNTFST